MNVYVGPRVSGKTTEAIKYCIENGYTLVVALTVLADTLKRGNEGLKCISWYDFTNKFANDHHGKYVIDDIGRCIEISLGVEIEAITVLGMAVPLTTFIENKGLLNQKKMMTKEEFKKSFPGVNL